MSARRCRTASLARVIPKMAGIVGMDPSTLFPCSSRPSWASMGFSSEYTHVISEASNPLSPDLTADATGQTLDFMTGAIRTAPASRWRAAPIEENVLIRASHAALRRHTFILTVSMASIRTSNPPSRISGTVSSDTRTSIVSTSTSGLMLSARRRAASVFLIPMVSRVARTCLFRLLSEKTSRSTTRILPTPARTSPSKAYPPTAPHPHRTTDDSRSRSTPSFPIRISVRELRPSAM